MVNVTNNDSINPISILLYNDANVSTTIIIELKALIAQIPYYYNRYSLPTPNKTSITINAGTLLNINNKGYITQEDKVLQTSTVDTPTNLAGKDVYIYAVEDSSSEDGVNFVLSLNSTVPDGYNATNSRKIGGFHCLCNSVGEISGHPLSGYITGDILPRSVWDLIHRPVSDPEGMVYNPQINMWSDIYLSSYEGSGTDCILKSKYNGVVADGTSELTFSWFEFAYCFGRQNKRMPSYMEFIALAMGSNAGTNIQGATDANITGGHVDTAGRRMISNDGNEDCCGFMWQWSSDIIGSVNGSNWGSIGINKDTWPELVGDWYGSGGAVLFGGNWDDSSRCGPVSSDWRAPLSYRWNICGARGLALPRSGLFGS